ncbi:MAG: AlpA family phage regulatory protein [Roseovarius sp.]|jgi:predicted DNA-binding transcriptional regulator AlpA|nr:AlpA family phage regulatory protein [Roseovarius sp.]
MTIKPTLLDPLLDIKAVSEALCRSRASIYRDINAKAFPKPLKICGSARWRTSQVRDFIEGLRSEED